MYCKEKCNRAISKTRNCHPGRVRNSDQIANLAKNFKYMRRGLRPLSIHKVILKRLEDRVLVAANFHLHSFHAARIRDLSHKPPAIAHQTTTTCRCYVKQCHRQRLNPQSQCQALHHWHHCQTPCRPTMAALDETARWNEGRKSIRNRSSLRGRRKSRRRKRRMVTVILRINELTQKVGI